MQPPIPDRGRPDDEAERAGATAVDDLGAGLEEPAESLEPVAERPSAFAPAQPPVGLGGRWVVLLRDVILGGQDGLVNVLGLSLGLAAATGDARVIVTAGLAAAMAEAIAMAGVAYTASGAETAWTRQVGQRLRVRIEERSRSRAVGLRVGVQAHGWEPERVHALDRVLDDERTAWLAEIDALRAALAPVRERHPGRAALVVGVSTLAGSAVPLTPFVLLPVPMAAAVALVAGATVLAVVGGLRARSVDERPWRPALEMVAIGLLSALAGFVIGLVLRAPA